MAVFFTHATVPPRARRPAARRLMAPVTVRAIGTSPMKPSFTK